MTLRSIFLFPALLCIKLLSAQHACGDEAFRQLQKSNSRHYEEIEKQNNLAVKNYIDSHYGSAALSRPTAVTNYVIPVVFHVVHLSSDAYGSGTNISYAQITSQINALNAAFGKTYPSYNGQTHPAYAQNTTISFCLAKTAKPSSLDFYNGPGGVEYGVMRYADNTLTQHNMTNADATALTALTHPTAAHFPFSDYLNIWVVASINGSSGASVTMGYAPNPVMGPFPLDGVVMRSDIIGDNSTGNTFNLGYGLTQGKILAHELGHYLNLYHIFQGGCAGTNAVGAATDACDLNGDGICDTEPCTTQNIDCSQPIPNTCSASYATGTTTLDMIESYMSYADDDCMNTFTMNQSQRMWTHLNTARFNLWQTANLAATGIIGVGGCISPFLMTDINTSTNNICAGNAFTLSNPTTGNTATSTNWLMAGATPSTAATKSVSVTYSSPGQYWTYLTVSDGIITAKDSFLVQVANCALDSTRLNRAHWFFGEYGEINFNTPVATTGTSALTYSTMTLGRDATVSMSDKKGNLLFYTNCSDLWDGNHVKINTSQIFPVDVNMGTTSPGVIAIPYPNDSARYIIITSVHYTLFEDSIYYVVYNVNTKALTQRRGFRNPALPNFYAESLTTVPHCNGIDYWVICRPRNNTPNPNRAFSMLITQAGPEKISKVTVSNNVHMNYSGQFRSNRKGNKLIQAGWDYGSLAYLYDFNQSTGALTNELAIGTNTVFGYAYGAIFSLNDSLAYVLKSQAGGYRIHQVSVPTGTFQTMSTPASLNSLDLEYGPDNNIYVSQSEFLDQTMGRIINTNSIAGAAYVPGVLVFPPGARPFGGLCNFMEADEKQPIAIDYMPFQTACNTFKFTVDSCWQVYNVSWNFGDGTTANGFTVNHTFPSTGNYTVKMVLSTGTYSLAPVLKNITVLSGITAITGPPVICKGSTFLNTYGANAVPGATYNWSVSNASISGPNNLSNVNVGSVASGVATLSLQLISGGCISNGTKTITIDAVPTVSLQSAQTACIGNMLSLNGSPAGGTYNGTGVSGSTFNASLAGIGPHVISYVYSNTNGCSGSASKTVTVSACVGINESEEMNSFLQLYPNPNHGLFTISPGRELANGRFDIYNSLGQLILSGPLQQSTEVNLSQYSNGIYFVKISENNKLIHTAKFLKE
jgi:hypothetical protein